MSWGRATGGGSDASRGKLIKFILISSDKAVYQSSGIMETDQAWSYRV